MTDNANVVAHYTSDGLVERLKAAMSASGLAGRTLTPAELAPLDQFHTRGLAATEELAEATGIARGTHVIDVGSGLGGPSRYLAAAFGCHVSGIDLSASFVAAASYLAGLTGLAERVEYRQADALALPFAASTFDLAWTQHVAMNIADRAKLYAEVHRVLQPGGRFAIYDVVAGNGEPVVFPVPWARTPSESFLVTATAMRALLEDAGFSAISWADKTEQGAAWFAAQQQARTQPDFTPPAVGLGIAMGPDFAGLAANLGRNLREGRVNIIQAVMQRA